jgi:predicted nucleotidyltransferase
VTRLDPARIYLLGSRAEGRARADSHFDLLVVMPDDAPKEWLTIDYAYEAKCELGIAADVIPCTEAEFEAEKDDLGSLCRVARRRGVLVCECGREDRGAPRHRRR